MKSGRARARCLQRSAIDLVDQLEAALLNQILKYFYNLARGRRACVLKIPTGRANLIEYTKQIIRCAGDRSRDCGKIDIFRFRGRGRFGGDCQKQTEMFAQWHQGRSIGQKQFAKKWRGEKPNTEERDFMFEQLRTQ